jgi:hypothetical protein
MRWRAAVGVEMSKWKTSLSIAGRLDEKEDTTARI